MQRENEQSLLDTKAVAVALGVSKWTVYRLVKARELEQHGYKVRKVGRLLRFERCTSQTKQEQYEA